MVGLYGFPAPIQICPMALLTQCAPHRPPFHQEGQGHLGFQRLKGAGRAQCAPTDHCSSLNKVTYCSKDVERVGWPSVLPTLAQEWLSAASLAGPSGIVHPVCPPHWPWQEHRVPRALSCCTWQCWLPGFQFTLGTCCFLNTSFLQALPSTPWLWSCSQEWYVWVKESFLMWWRKTFKKSFLYFTLKSIFQPRQRDKAQLRLNSFGFREGRN